MKSAMALLLIVAPIAAIAALYVIPIASVAYAVAMVSFVPTGLIAALVKPEATWRDLLLSWVIFWAFYTLFATIVEAPTTLGMVLSIALHCYSVIAAAIIIKIAMKGSVFLANYESPMRRLTLTQCMLSAAIINVVSGLKPTFDYPLMAVIIALSATLFSMNLLIHLRINANNLDNKQRMSALVVTFALITVCAWTINWSSLALSLVAYFVLPAQTIVLLLRFTMSSPARYWLTVTALVSWIATPLLWMYFV